MQLGQVGIRRRAWLGYGTTDSIAVHTCCPASSLILQVNARGAGHMRANAHWSVFAQARGIAEEDVRTKPGITA